MSSSDAGTLRQRLTPHRLSVMMVATLVLFVISPLLPRFVGEAGLMVLVCAFVWIERGHRQFTRVLLPLMALLTLVFIAMEALCPDLVAWRTLRDRGLGVGLRCIAIVFLGYCWVIILLALLHAERVTHDEIAGTVTLYVLAALIWAGAYGLLEECVPGSFGVEISKDHFVRDLREDDAMRFKLMYFSFITLATQGYGDITPQNVVAERLVVLETIFGQFYVAVVVAYLVSLLMKQRAANGDRNGTGQEGRAP